MSNTITINREHKDRLFKKLFGGKDNKENLLSLYNALNDTNYTNADDLTINTIDDVIYMSMRNDVSCIIDNYMSLYEQQSTFNPNMPLRGLLYFARLYDKYIIENDLDIYGKILRKIPTPQFYVFYNGTTQKPDKIILKLSDAFEHPIHEGSFEWTATMLNINYGQNKELMKKCHVLKEYSIFIDKINKYRKLYKDITAAVEKTVEECIQKNILKDFLTAHRAEVISMVLEEYNEQKTLKALAEDSRAEGRIEGLQEGKIDTLMSFLNELGPVPTDLVNIIQKQTDLSVLEHWIHIAARSDSVADFETKLKIHL